MKSRNFKKKFTRNNNERTQQQDTVSKYEYNVQIGSKMYQKAQQCKSKYLEMAKESFSGGDRVMGETYLQHADHYARILNEAHQIQKDNQKNHQQHNNSATESSLNPIGENSDEISTDLTKDDDMANLKLEKNNSISDNEVE